MKSPVLAFLLVQVLVFTVLHHGYSQNLEFVRYAGGEDRPQFGESGNSIAVDGKGNIYVIGYMMDGAMFGEGEENQTTFYEDGVYLAKYSNSGMFIWAQELQSDGITMGGGIDIDRNGNVYISGLYTNNVTFGAGQATETTLQGPNEYTEVMYIAKYAADGKLLWAKGAQTGTEGFSSGAALAVDGSGNVYVTGSFVNTIAFGAGEVNAVTLTGHPEFAEIYLAKYSPAGNIIWAQQAHGPFHDDGKSVALDEQGNVYLSGHFFDLVSFGLGLPNETSLENVNVSAFIAKYTAEGAFVWAIIPYTSRAADYSGGISVDKQGNVALAATYNFEITLGKGTAKETVLSGKGKEEILLAKFNAAGEFLWAKSPSSPGEDFAESVATDPLGNIYLSGYYSGRIYFGKGELNETPLYHTGGKDIFLAKYDPNGELLWVTRAGGSKDDIVADVAVDYLGNSYLTGSCLGTAEFGKGEPQQTTIPVQGYSDMFVAKFGNHPIEKPTGLEDVFFGSVLLYPNPAHDFLTIHFEKPAVQSFTLKLEGLDGVEYFSKEVRQGEINPLSFDTRFLPKGMYLLIFIGKEGSSHRKIIKH